MKRLLYLLLTIVFFACSRSKDDERMTRMTMNFDNLNQSYDDIRTNFNEGYSAAQLTLTNNRDDEQFYQLQITMKNLHWNAGIYDTADVTSATLLIDEPTCTHHLVEISDFELNIHKFEEQKELLFGGWDYGSADASLTLTADVGVDCGTDSTVLFEITKCEMKESFVTRTAE